MPTLNIDGKTVQVDQSFLSLSPDEQNATVDEIAQSLGHQPSDSGQGGLNADNIVRSAAQGIPIVGGLADKFAAGMDALTQPVLGRGSDASTLGQRYAQNVSAEQAHSRAFDTQHPIASTAANIAGGVAGIGGAIKAVPALGSAMGFGSGSLLGNVAKGAATNAAIGGADAAVRGQDPISGAEWGAGFGAAGPIVGRAIGGIAGKFSAPVSTADRIAINKVAAPFTREGVTTPEGVIAKLNDIGPEAMLVDAHPDLTQMGGAIASSPGDGQQILRSALTDRAGTAADRISGTVNDVMGKPVDLSKVADEISTTASRQVKPLYAEAYKSPVQMTPELQQVLDTPSGIQAMNRAKTLALNSPNSQQSTMFAPKQAAAPLPEWAQSVMDKGGPGADNLKAALQKSGVISSSQGSVDVRGLHLIRQAFDDMIERASSPVTSAGKNSLGALKANRAVIGGALKQVEPMAQADAIFADKARVQRAMADGLDIFKNSQSPEDIAAALSKMSEAERQGFIQGGRVAVRNAMGTARNDAAAARSMFSKEFNKEKLALLVGNDGADTVLKRIGAEQAYNASTQRITANSETASRLQGKADLADAHGIPSYRDVAIFSGTHGLVRRAAVGAVNSAIEAVQSGKQREIETAIAKMLTAKGVDRADAIQKLMSAAYKSDKSGKTNRLIAQVVARFPLPRDDASNRRSQQFQERQLSIR